MKHNFQSKFAAGYRQSDKIPTPPLNEKISSTNNEKPVISFELFDFNHECPSTWQNHEIRQLFQMFNKVCQITWLQVLKTGGKNKTGLGFTEFTSDPFQRPKSLSPDLTISEMRVNKKSRVFGIRLSRTYYILRLDRNHETCR